METTTQENTSLVLASNWLEITGEELPKEAGQLPAEKVQTLANIFEPFMRQVVELRKEAMQMLVTDEDDKAGMNAAAKLRKTIKAIRTNAEKHRKEEKQFSLITGRMVQWFGNQINDLAKLTEAHLQEQETYAARMEQQRLDAIGEKREKEIYQFASDEVQFPGLATMSEEDYQSLLNQTREAFEYRQMKAKQEEQERLQREAEAKAERERLEADRAKLRAIEEQQAKEAAEAAAKKAEAEATLAPVHNNDPIKAARFELWSFFNDEHNLILLESDLDEIIRRVQEFLSVSEESAA